MVLIIKQKVHVATNTLFLTYLFHTKSCISHTHINYCKAIEINLPFLRTLSKKLHFSAYTRCYHTFTIITNAFHTTCFYLPFYNTFTLYYTAPTVHCQSYKNNYFNIRHVLNEQLNHSLEFSAPMSFKFVTTI